MSTLPNLLIRRAVSADVPAILAVQRKNLISNLLPNSDIPSLQSRGFLIGAMSEESIRTIVEDPKGLTLVARSERGVMGYVIAYERLMTLDVNSGRLSKVKYLDATSAMVENTSPSNLSFDFHQPILYIASIAVDVDQAKGSGTPMMQALVQNAKARGYSAILDMVIQSPWLNQGSLNFHHKNGFERIGTYEATYDDGMYDKLTYTSSVMLLSLQPGGSTSAISNA